nr:MAG TPA: hypothetical protein [Caudoviricetes sp.]
MNSLSFLNTKKLFFPLHNEHFILSPFFNRD